MTDFNIGDKVQITDAGDSVYEVLDVGAGEVWVQNVNTGVKLSADTLQVFAYAPPPPRDIHRWVVATYDDADYGQVGQSTDMTFHDVVTINPYVDFIEKSAWRAIADAFTVGNAHAWLAYGKARDGDFAGALDELA